MNIDHDFSIENTTSGKVCDMLYKKCAVKSLKRETNIALFSIASLMNFRDIFIKSYDIHILLSIIMIAH